MTNSQVGSWKQDFFGGATILVKGTNLLFFLGSIACFQKEYSLKIRVPFLGLKNLAFESVSRFGGVQ